MTQPTQITGSILIGQDEARGSSSFAAISAATGEALGPPFQDADATHVAQACALAAQAWGEFSERSPAVRAQFLELKSSRSASL
jgi:NADP-dependent aldehyde dehydrogenase